MVAIVRAQDLPEETHKQAEARGACLAEFLRELTDLSRKFGIVIELTEPDCDDGWRELICSHESPGDRIYACDGELMCFDTVEGHLDEMKFGFGEEWVFPTGVSAEK